MSILNKEEAKIILDKVMSFSQADACEANIDGGTDGNIRYARNTVTTAGETSNISLVVQSSFGKKSGTVTVNEFDDETLKKSVRMSEELAKLSPENPEFMEPLGPQKYLESKAFFDSTEQIVPEYRAKAAADSIMPAKEKGLVAAGFLEDYVYFEAMTNSNGLFAYHKETGVDFTVTMRTKDGTGSGWVTRDVNDVNKLSTASASNIAIQKALMSKEAKAIEPGKYTVILEPAASVGLLQNLIYSMNARSADEGRSFLSKAGGGNKLGEQIVDERVNIYTDPLNAEIPGQTWNSSGMPRKKMNLIEKGTVKNLFYGRYWAQKQGVDPVPYPSGAVMEGDNSKSLEDLIRSTKKGILVTRTWYIRTVDPATLLYTGLTRDGTFYIEDGEIQFPVKNFRFNESPIIMLNNLEALAKPQRIGGSLVPPMKINDFTFTSLSDAI